MRYLVAGDYSLHVDYWRAASVRQYHRANYSQYRAGQAQLRTAQSEETQQQTSRAHSQNPQSLRYAHHYQRNLQPSLDDNEAVGPQTQHQLREDQELLQVLKGTSPITEFKVLVLNYIASQLSQTDIMLLGKIFLEIDKNKDGYLTV